MGGSGAPPTGFESEAREGGGRLRILSSVCLSVCLSVRTAKTQKNGNSGKLQKLAKLVPLFSYIGVGGSGAPPTGFESEAREGGAV